MAKNNNIKHFEDLSFDEISFFIKHHGKFSLSEKIDGSNLCFGFDKTGNFFTSRELKGGKRYYSESDYPKQFWTTPFRFAHCALERISGDLLKKIGKDSLIEIEVLYGKTPNTINYNLERNRIVVLKTISGISELKNISYKCINVTLKDIPNTKYGYDFILEEKSSDWDISVNPLEKVVLKNPSLISDHSFIVEKESLTKITKNNKEDILLKRKLTSEAKLNIKFDIINSLITKNSHLNDKVLAEGFVISNGDIVFKLVDKEAFTAANAENHKLQKEISELFWKPVSKYIKSLNLLNQDGFDSDKKNIVDLCNESIKGLVNYPRTLHSNKVKISKDNFNKLLQNISGLKNRLENLKLAAMCSNNMDHLCDLENNNIKNKTFSLDNNVSRIHKNDIRETVHSLEEALNFKTGYLEKNLLGSAGKSITSGDIDICLDKNTIKDKSILLSNLKKNKMDFKESVGLDIIHIKAPICGDEKNGLVQVDFMFCENPEWTKFWYFSPEAGQSKYKGLYRNLLLGCAIAQTNQVFVENNEVVKKIGWTCVPKNGLIEQIRERKVSKNGVRNKSFTVISEGKQSFCPNKAIEIIFKDVKINLKEIETFEGLWSLLKKHKSKKDLMEIKEITEKTIKKLKYKTPEEFIYGI